MATWEWMRQWFLPVACEDPAKGNLERGFGFGE